ncbi:hypothetical protein [Nonomuraea sp. NPDC049129]|uniref:hypothetical protein n=1 Tax=Nonomuraea sp. NPDC049129 TaxID=3155272 RepID=UPI0033FB8CC0
MRTTARQVGRRRMPHLPQIRRELPHGPMDTDPLRRDALRLQQLNHRLIHLTTLRMRSREIHRQPRPPLAEE